MSRTLNVSDAQLRKILTEDLSSLPPPPPAEPPTRPPLPRTILCTTPAQALSATTALSNLSEVSLIVHMSRASRHASVCAISMTAPGNKLYLFDMQCALAKAMLARGGLGTLLMTPDVTKVMHDCRVASHALWRDFGVPLAGVFDTQVGLGAVRVVRGLQRKWWLGDSRPLATGLSCSKWRARPFPRELVAHAKRENLRLLETKNVLEGEVTRDGVWMIVYCGARDAFLQTNAVQFFEFVVQKGSDDQLCVFRQFLHRPWGIDGRERVLKDESLEEERDRIVVRHGRHAFCERAFSKRESTELLICQVTDASYSDFIY